MLFDRMLLVPNDFITIDIRNRGNNKHAFNVLNYKSIAS